MNLKHFVELAQESGDLVEEKLTEQQFRKLLQTESIWLIWKKQKPMPFDLFLFRTVPQT